MVNRKKNYRVTNKSSPQAKISSTTKELDDLINQTKTRDNKHLNRGVSSNKLLKVTILSIIILSSGFIIIGALNNSPHSLPTSIDKELPNNMIQQYDPNLMSASNVQEAYDYGKTNGLLLEQLKCYCGCESFHNNNRQCFWKDDGSLDTHAQTCGICVYTALAAKQLNEAGWSGSEIRAFIDSKFQ